jgi:hypothetical protein
LSVQRGRRRTQEIVQVSDGTRVYSEGQIDLAGHSWKGKLYEWA